MNINLIQWVCILYRKTWHTSCIFLQQSANLAIVILLKFDCQHSEHKLKRMLFNKTKQTNQKVQLFAMNTFIRAMNKHLYTVTKQWQNNYPIWAEWYRYTHKHIIRCNNSTVNVSLILFVWALLRHFGQTTWVRYSSHKSSATLVTCDISVHLSW